MTALALYRPVWNTLDERTLDERIENWANAYLWGAEEGRYASIASAEGLYRSPQHWHQPRPSTRPGIDVDDADDVELAVCCLPRFDQVLLRSWYIDRQPEYLRNRMAALAMSARAAGKRVPRRRDFDVLLLRARHGLELALALPKGVRRAIARTSAMMMLRHDDAPAP